MQALAILFVLSTIIIVLKSEYIPPGPRYTCPKETEKHLLYPCVCETGTDDGLFIRCSNAGLAVMSIGLGNLAGLGLPIEQLVLQECKICKYAKFLCSLIHKYICKLRAINISINQ